jgi:hypothetical protein
MKTCPRCGEELDEESRFCTQCGTLVAVPSDGAGRATEEMNVPILYAMVAFLIAALLFPPWESPPNQPPEFLGFRFILMPPTSRIGDGGVISRLLLTIELMTIAAGGFYFAWLFRARK